MTYNIKITIFINSAFIFILSAVVQDFKHPSLFDLFYFVVQQMGKQKIKWNNWKEPLNKSASDNLNNSNTRQKFHELFGLINGLMF